MAFHGDVKPQIWLVNFIDPTTSGADIPYRQRVTPKRKIADENLDEDDDKKPAAKKPPPSAGS